MSGDDELPGMGSLDEVTVPGHEFDCSLCLKVYFDPVVTPACGHTFCRLCLQRALEVKKNCPLCRAPCNVDILEHPPNALLVRILENYAREAYTARAEEAAVERRQRRQRFSLFYTSEFIAFPGSENIHLYVYEPKYRVMVDRALATTRQFVMVRHDEPVGVVLHILRCNAHPDGRSVLQCRAQHRVTIEHVEAEEHAFGLECAAVRVYGDLPEEEQGEDAAARQELVGLVRDKFLEMAAAQRSNPRLQEAVSNIPVESPEQLSFWLCDLLPREFLTAVELQQVLACRLVNERLRLCLGLMDKVIVKGKRKSLIVVLVVVALIAAAIMSQSDGGQYESLSRYLVG